MNRIGIIVLSLFILICGCEKEKPIEPDQVPSYIIVSPEGVLTFVQEGGVKDIEIETNYGWEAILSSSWFTLSLTSGEAGKYSLQVSCSENSVDKIREGTITIVSADSYLVITVVQPKKVSPPQVPISSLLFDKWIFRSGLVFGFFEEALYSQIIEFKENGNLEETVYAGTPEYGDTGTRFTTATTLGNWSGANNKIVLNDWDGNILSDTLYVNYVTETELSLTYRGSTAKFVKEASALSNLEQDIVGRWDNITFEERVGFYLFNNDKTGRYTSWGTVGGSWLSSGASFTWWIEENMIVMHDQGTASGWNHSVEVNFINDKYIGFNGAVRIKKR